MKKIFCLIIIPAILLSAASCQKAEDALWKKACAHLEQKAKDVAAEKGVDKAVSGYLDTLNKFCGKDFKVTDTKKAVEFASCILSAKSGDDARSCGGKMK